MGKVYVASKFENVLEVRAAQDALRARGHTITHDWTRAEDVDLPDAHRTLEMDRAFAEADVAGVEEADAVLAIDRPGTLGTWIEVGIAVARRTPVVLVPQEGDARRRSVFFHLDGVRVVDGGLPEGIEAVHGALTRAEAEAPSPLRHGCARAHVDDYARCAARTLDPALTHRDVLSLCGLGIGGEAGEVVEILKKHLYHDRRDVDGALVEEVGDLLWYLANLATARGFSLETAMRRNVAKLIARRPDPAPAPWMRRFAAGAKTSPLRELRSEVETVEAESKGPPEGGFTRPFELGPSWQGRTIQHKGEPILLARDDDSSCGSVGGSWDWSCDRLPGHLGDHVACCARGDGSLEIVASWESSRVSPEASP